MIGRHEKKQVNSDVDPGNKRHVVNSGDLLRVIFAKPRTLHFVLLIICIILGMALVTQIREQRSDPLDRMSQQDLVELLGQLSSQEDRLRGEKVELDQQLTELNDNATAKKAAEEAARKKRKESEIAAGSAPVTGRGLTMLITDNSHVLGPLDLVTTWSEMRNAGAEAASLNGIRLTARSWFDIKNGTLICDGHELSSPYRWTVIGSPDDMAAALEIAAGAAQQIRARGGQVVIAKNLSLTINDLAVLPTPQWATIDDDKHDGLNSKK